jgi:hypothetical protein
MPHNGEINIVIDGKHNQDDPGNPRVKIAGLNFAINL